MIKLPTFGEALRARRAALAERIMAIAPSTSPEDCEELVTLIELIADEAIAAVLDRPCLELGERIESLLDSTDEEAPQGQKLWRLRGMLLSDARIAAMFIELINDCRRTAIELRDIARQLEEAAVKTEEWTRLRSKVTRDE